MNAKLRPSLPQCVFAGVAQALTKLHEAGYVYNNVKPSDIAWSSDKSSWELLDFSRCVAEGMIVPFCALSCGTQ